MTDLTTRLRDMSQGAGYEPWPTLDEAADEIDRLRAQIAEALAELSSTPGGVHQKMRLRAILSRGSQGAAEPSALDPVYVADARNEAIDIVDRNTRLGGTGKPRSAEAAVDALIAWGWRPPIHPQFDAEQEANRG